MSGNKSGFDTEAVIALWGAGWSPSLIAEVLGSTAGSISNLARRVGLPGDRDRAAVERQRKALVADPAGLSALALEILGRAPLPYDAPVGMSKSAVNRRRRESREAGLKPEPRVASAPRFQPKPFAARGNLRLPDPDPKPAPVERKARKWRELPCKKSRGPSPAEVAERIAMAINAPANDAPPAEDWTEEMDGRILDTYGRRALLRHIERRHNIPLSRLQARYAVIRERARA